MSLGYATGSGINFQNIFGWQKSKIYQYLKLSNFELIISIYIYATKTFIQTHKKTFTIMFIIIVCDELDMT